MAKLVGIGHLTVGMPRAAMYDGGKRKGGICPLLTNACITDHGKRRFA
jgi:hypothetical protein